MMYMDEVKRKQYVTSYYCSWKFALQKVETLSLFI